MYLLSAPIRIKLGTRSALLPMLRTKQPSSSCKQTRKDKLLAFVKVFCLLRYQVLTTLVLRKVDTPSVPFPSKRHAIFRSKNKVLMNMIFRVSSHQIKCLDQFFNLVWKQYNFLFENCTYFRRGLSKQDGGSSYFESMFLSMSFYR